MPDTIVIVYMVKVPDRESPTVLWKLSRGR